ncbi:metal ABC transporter substrate-binding protein [Vagococcus xieshaowenii]|uniref:Zinc ABC transporter substrate-binding protein n=1 Tax=Vagococcus xieshaowenii TaxID=2562451 RepID=A0AAJ5EGK9_9ENTE|nr:metal ABC transporter substrate-binding protein [Vagococcus xieshaowenii]QCA28768.1 zinc ABC transporter substrate-binding protein [Vagococcus xieshaowenii]TFZ43031.1 zinc ABC transporter substrate-binding protein [Vagococcus xieshaowenii]
MKKIVLVLAGLFTALSVTACAKKNDSNKNDEGLKVVTTFYPVYDFTKSIVGDKGEVSMLLSGEIEPHDYEPSAKDIAKIQSADIFVYSSEEMETWVSSVLANIDTDKTKVVEASKGIDFLEEAEEHEHAQEADSHEHEDEHDHEVEDHEGHHHEVDPHVWLSPLLAKKQVATITKGLIEVDEKNSDFYQANADSFKTRLDDLDHDFHAAFQDATNKTFVTQHAAFGYLANEYGLDQVSIAGLTPDIEPSPKQLAALQDFVKESHVHYIYVEQSGSSKYADTISKATGADVLTLSTLETVSSKDIEDGKDYFSIMNDNLDALKQSIN